MELVDTHIHLYAEEYGELQKELINNAIEAGVTKFILPNIDSTSINGLHLLTKKYPNNCFGMMGLHPCYVTENYQDELANVKQLLDSNKYYAVGEIGMDKYWSLDFILQQEEALRTQLKWASELDLPVSLHTRNATREVIDIISELNLPNRKGVFHCFGGTIEEAEEIIKLGYHLGIGGVVTFKNSGLEVIIKEVPLEKIVLETDGPYPAPMPFRGKRNDPKYLRIIAEKIASVKNISLELVASTTTTNANQIFGL
jgi:TatD DNase family protein